MQRFAKKHDIDMDASFAYSDSAATCRCCGLSQCGGGQSGCGPARDRGARRGAGDALREAGAESSQSRAPPCSRQPPAGSAHWRPGDAKAGSAAFQAHFAGSPSAVVYSPTKAGECLDRCATLVLFKCPAGGRRSKAARDWRTVPKSKPGIGTHPAKRGEGQSESGAPCRGREEQALAADDQRRIRRGPVRRPTATRAQPTAKASSRLATSRRRIEIRLRPIETRHLRSGARRAPNRNTRAAHATHLAERQAGRKSVRRPASPRVGR